MTVKSNKDPQTSTEYNFFLFSVSFLAGFFNGLFGTGGGIFLWLYLSRKKPLSTAFATSAASVFLLCLFSLIISDAPRESSILLPIFTVLCILGGAFGGWICKKIKEDFLQFLFGILLILSGGYSLLISLR